MTAASVAPTAEAGAGDGATLLELKEVVKQFPVRSERLFGGKRETLRAVDGVSLSVRRGETIGLVGETGCGKSTLARCITRLYDLTSGTVTFGGDDISRLSGRQLRPYRRKMQMVFQDPYGSLNPRRRVGSIIADPFAANKLGSGAGTQGQGAGADGGRGPESGALQPVPGRVLRWPAAAYRPRPGAGTAAGTARLRRAGLRPRRLDPGADHQPAGRPAAASWD